MNGESLWWCGLEIFCRIYSLTLIQVWCMVMVYHDKCKWQFAMWQYLFKSYLWFLHTRWISTFRWKFQIILVWRILINISAALGRAVGWVDDVDTGFILVLQLAQLSRSGCGCSGERSKNSNKSAIITSILYVAICLLCNLRVMKVSQFGESCWGFLSSFTNYGIKKHEDEMLMLTR